MTPAMPVQEDDKMESLQPKRVQDSVAEEIQLVLAQHLNGDDRLFGGQLTAWIDILAGVVARRHCGKNVTTACIDNLRFRKAAHGNDIIVLKGRITHVGHTSMEVRVDTYIEDITGLREQINTAYLVMVALDENEKPTPVPPLILETEQEKIAWEAAERRQELRRQRRIEQF